MEFIREYERVSHYDAVRAGLNIVSDREFQKNFIAVSKIAAEALEKTLGPFAHTTLIDDGSSVYSTKDGWNIVNRLQFGDALQNSLYSLIKDISFHLVSTVGDGTTTAIVAANEMIQLLMSDDKYADIRSMRQQDVLESMRKVIKEMTKILESDEYIHFVSDDNDFDDIYKIAMVSSNENETVSRIIQKIYNETKNPNISVRFGNGRDVSYEIQTGYKLDSKPRNFKAFINTDEGVFKGVDVSTLFIDHNVTYAEHLEVIRAVMEYASETGKPILIFAPHFDDIITGAIAEDMNKYIRAGKVPNICPIQIPLAMSSHKFFFEDSAMITKSLIFSPVALKECFNISHPKDDDGNYTPLDSITRTRIILNLKKKLANYIGSCESVIVSETYTLFEKFDVENQAYKNTLKEVEELYNSSREKASKDMSPINKEFMDVSMRYIKLYGRMGIIDVGAQSDLESRCLKDSIDDAVLACKSAYLNGYIQGMNLATISASRKIANLSEQNKCFSKMDTLMAELISNVFVNVTSKVMKNKYDTDERVWAFKYKEIDEKKSYNEIIDLCVQNNIGYDIVSETVQEDSLKVINSVKTDIEIISAMLSIVTHVLTSNQMLSLNRMFDKEIGKKMIKESELEKYTMIADAIVRVLEAKNCKLF